MKLPIPDDWPDKQWRCVQIQWPDSPLWVAILHGWLSQMARGRIWNEDTGSVLDAMAVGRAIWERNTPLVGCDGNEIEPPGATPDAGGVGGWWDCEDDDMPCVDISRMLKIEGGKLYALDGCCNWQEIGPLAGGDIAEDIGDTPLEVPGEDPPDYYACGKAEAAARIVFDVATACFEQFDSYPWQYVQNVEKDLGLDLNNQWVIQAVLQAVQLEALGYTAEEVTSDADRAWLKCQLEMKFADNAAAATEDDFKSARSLMRSHVAPDVFLMNFWDYTFLALGWRKFAQAAQLGATTQGDCSDCGEIIAPTPVGSVFFTGSYSLSFKPDGAANPVVVLNGPKNKATVTLSGTQTAEYTDYEFWLQVAMTEPITTITVRHRGNCSTEEWLTPKAPDLTDLRPGNWPAGQTVTQSVVGGSVQAGYIDVEYSWSSPESVLWFGHGSASTRWRINPRNIAHPWTVEASFEILNYS